MKSAESSFRLFAAERRLFLDKNNIHWIIVSVKQICDLENIFGSRTYLIAIIFSDQTQIFDCKNDTNIENAILKNPSVAAQSVF